VAVMNKARHVVAFERFNKIDWVYQKRKIISVAKKYNGARVLIDSTGVGDPIYDDLSREVDVRGYKFTHASKNDLINNLGIHVSERTVSFPNIPELVQELKIFGHVKPGSKKVVYEAPDGYHDDCVIGLALAAECVDTKGVSFAIMEYD